MILCAPQQSAWGSGFTSSRLPGASDGRRLVMPRACKPHASAVPQSHGPAFFTDAPALALTVPGPEQCLLQSPSPAEPATAELIVKPAFCRGQPGEARRLCIRLGAPLCPV